MARPKKHVSMLMASRDEACLAVRLYNDPSEIRSFEGFVVHMHLAWLYLLHAELSHQDIDFRYRQRDKPRLLVRVDGEPKCWELARCVAHRWPKPEDPTRLNIEFFIGLRNKIEHRYARQQRALATALGGHAQAWLLNYERELTDEFGLGLSLATKLQFPVFIGSFTAEGEQALRCLRKTLPAALRKYIVDFHAGLGVEAESDPRFEMRLRVATELAPKDPDALALQFTQFHEMTEEERTVVEKLGRKGMVITKDRSRRVSGYGLKKPMKVVEEVAAAIPYRFNMSHFSKAWKALEVRPATGADRPEVTDERYCIYDELNKNYGYTLAYVKKLIRECSTEEGFRHLLDASPMTRLRE